MNNMFKRIAILLLLTVVLDISLASSWSIPTYTNVITYLSTESNYTVAKQLCQSNGSHLFGLDDYQGYLEIQRLREPANVEDEEMIIWLNAEWINGQYRWPTGQPVRWASLLKPNTSNSISDQAAALFLHPRYNDLHIRLTNATEKHHVFCQRYFEIPATTRAPPTSQESTQHPKSNQTPAEPWTTAAKLLVVVPIVSVAITLVILAIPALAVALPRVWLVAAGAVATMVASGLVMAVWVWW